MNLIILGAGGFGNVVADIALQTQKYSKILFLDDNDSNDIIIGKLDDYKQYINDNTEFFPALGNNKLRYEWFQELANSGASIATIIHPSSYLSPTATIGKGTIVLPKACINTNVVLCYACIINIGSIIDHDCFLGVGVHVAPGAIVKADNVITAYEKIESGTVIQARQFPKDTLK